jgi:hypothetical protein
MDLEKLTRKKWYDRLLYFISGFGLAGSIFACSPIERHSRLVEKYPFVHTQDTVKIVDTVRITVPRIKVDTVLSLKMLTDTVIIEKDRLKIKLYRVRDSIYLEGKVDTLFIEKEVIRKVPVRYYVEKKRRDYLKIFVILSIVGFTLYALFRNRDKRINIKIDQKNEGENT